MAEKGKLPKDHLKEIQNFWEKIQDHLCPNCNKSSLVWEKE